jgi:serine/threonine-protein kinase
VTEPPDDVTDELFLPDQMSGKDYAGYAIGPCLGRGGFGAVYDARSPEGERVAVKFLFETGPRYLARFRRELAVGMRLEHPNVVRALGGDPDAELPYLVAEFVDGPSVAELLEKTCPLAPGTVYEIARQMLKGLGYLHDQGLVHRDVKPGNLLVGPEGVVQIVDFGLVHATDLETLTSSGRALGSCFYMAPEQFHGEVASVSADLYSAGLVIYRLLTGRSPYFRGAIANLAEYYQLVVTGEHLAWTPARAGGPLDLFLRRAGARRLDDRFADAREMFEAFRAAFEAEWPLPEIAPTSPTPAFQDAGFEDVSVSVLEVDL